MSISRVFISYSHDSEEHRTFVRGISDRLRHEGLNCHIDLYVNGSPAEGWPRWMEDQIEQADFVLLVCTPIYLQRYRGEERESGRGVTFEGVVISQSLYDHYYRNTKFIPVIPVDGSLEHVPLPLKGYTCYTLPGDYIQLYRVLTGQAEYIAPPIGSIRPLPPENVSAPSPIISDRLPTVKGEFFGREDELKLLNEAWSGNDTRIIQFIAPGGTGKTKLLQRWIDRHLENYDALITWSFYSQGSSEDKQTTASPFFSHAFDKLGSARDLSSFTIEEDKGGHLADLLRQRRAVLVLDGLEPLQHAGKGMRGELKDKAISQLLKMLSLHFNGLCIITTRIELPELDSKRHVISENLENLTLKDGVKLLQSLGVHGKEAELEKAVNEYGHHALALHLLGNALHTYLDGDI
ncbi:MAG: TIR and AAA domain-containing protein [Burkholderiales bacterium]|nr:TIR and AAA domain-containing protein [Nitrosomonas sp.]MCP5273467.1 TIR and AAA domain-containing protein [Burkholderiales bacterium]